MTRKLPWLSEAVTTTVPHSSGSARTAAPQPKRQRLRLGPSSDIDDIPGIDAKRHVSPKSRASPSPALEPPAESEMIEGLDHDDRFRMVEDEFLDAAKQFTQHLHAAEYQRMKKAARSQNAAAINSISRPVTIKMPDETRRKVESMARSKKQATALQGLLVKQSRGSGSDEESNDNESTWLGTALHGLMESSRKSTSSLTKVAKISVPTKAALGFSKPQHEKSFDRAMSYSPQPIPERQTRTKPAPQTESTTESFDDDDDLDPPIRTHEVSKSHRALKFSAKPGSVGVLGNSKNPPPDQPELAVKASKFESRYSETKELSVDESKAARERIAKRLEHAKLRERKQEEKKSEVIPMFLS